MIESITALLLIILLGYLILRIIKAGFFESLIDELPYAFAIGAGTIGIQLYLYSRLNLAWQLPHIILPWIIVMIVYSLRHPREKKIIFFPKLNFNWVGKISLAFVLLLLILTLIEAISRPVSAWDGWAIWLLKSKIFFIDNAIKSEIFSYTNSEYPILLSLIGTFFYTLIGKVDDTSILLLFFSFYLFLGVALFSILRKYASDNLAIVFTFLLLSTQNILRHGGRFEAGQADLALAFYMLVSVGVLLEYLKSNNAKILLLLNILLGLTSLIKYEGIPFTLFMQTLLVLNILKSKNYLHLLFSGVWLVIVVDWQIFKMLNNLPQNYILKTSAVHFDRSSMIASSFLNEFLNIVRWNILWPVFFIVSILKINNPKTYILYFIIFSQIGFYTFIYFITPINAKQQIDSSLDRLLIHVAPLATMTIALQLGDLFRNIKQFRLTTLINIRKDKVID